MVTYSWRMPDSSADRVWDMKRYPCHHSHFMRQGRTSHRWPVLKWYMEKESMALAILVSLNWQ